MKKILGPNLGPIETCLQIIFGLQIHFLDCYPSEFIHFAYYDRQQWYLAYSGGTVVEKKNLDPDLGLFRPKFGPKFDFQLIVWHGLIQLVWCHTSWFHSMVFDYCWCFLLNWPHNWGLLGVKNLVQNLVFSLCQNIDSYNICLNEF